MIWDKISCNDDSLKYKLKKTRECEIQNLCTINQLMCDLAIGFYFHHPTTRLGCLMMNRSKKEWSSIEKETG